MISETPSPPDRDCINVSGVKIAVSTTAAGTRQVSWDRVSGSLASWLVTEWRRENSLKGELEASPHEDLECRGEPPEPTAE